MRHGLAAATVAAAADTTTVKEQNRDEGSLRLSSQRRLLHLQMALPVSLPPAAVGVPFVLDERGW